MDQTQLLAAILVELQRLNSAIDKLPSAIVAAVMADLIERVPDEPAPVGCQHPTDKRVDLGDGDWECGLRECRFKFSANPEGAPV